MTGETTLRADPSRSMLPLDAFEVELELPAVPEHTHLLSHLAGVVACLRAGIDPTSVRRPLAEVPIEASRAKPTGRGFSGPRGPAAGETPLQVRSATDSDTLSVPARRANPEHES